VVTASGCGPVIRDYGYMLRDDPRYAAKAAQIARYAPDNSLIGVTSLNSDTVSLIDPTFREQTAIKVGSQPMDMAFRGDELFVACQGDGFAARDIAATEAVTAASGGSLRDAAQLMAEHGVSHLIVLDQANGQPVGVLSSTDILAAYAIASGARSKT